MSAPTLPVLSHSQFPQVFALATELFVERLADRPQLGRCASIQPFAHEVVRCSRKATVQNLADGMEYCAACFAEVEL
jgi:hypothetical protein